MSSTKWLSEEMKKLSESVRLKVILTLGLMSLLWSMESMHFWQVMFGQNDSFFMECPRSSWVTSTHSSSSVLMRLVL